MADKERIQLNLRLDGRPDLLDAIKEAARAEDTSVNAWAVAVLADKLGIATSKPAPTEDLESAVASVLDKLLAKRLATIKSELRAELGELRA
jgi:hypothetical protein